MAVVGGAGSGDLATVAGQVDCFITGDTRYNDGELANYQDMLLIDVGHHVEQICEVNIQRLLKDLDVEVLLGQDKGYFQDK